MGLLIIEHPKLTKVIQIQKKINYHQTVDHYALGLIISEIFEPVNVLNLSQKFYCVKQGPTGKIKEKFGQIYDLIIKLTYDDPIKRYEIDSIGKPLKIKWPYTENKNGTQILNTVFKI